MFEIGAAQHDYMLNILSPLWVKAEMFAMREFLSGSVTSVCFWLSIDGSTRWFHGYCDLSDKGSPERMTRVSPLVVESTGFLGRNRNMTAGWRSLESVQFPLLALTWIRVLATLKRATTDLGGRDMKIGEAAEDAGRVSPGRLFGEALRLLRAFWPLAVFAAGLVSSVASQPSMRISTERA